MNMPLALLKGFLVRIERFRIIESPRIEVQRITRKPAGLQNHRAETVAKAFIAAKGSRK